MGTEETPFVDLPAALVEEVIQQTAELGDILLDSFHCCPIKFKEKGQNPHVLCYNDFT